MKTLTPHDRKVALLLLTAFAALVGVGMMPAIPQDPAYHNFADAHTLFGIPNFWNVIGNAPFIFVGILGLMAERRLKAGADWALFSFGVLLTAFGSGWYHLLPSNESLVWDRLPMTIAFTAFFAAIIRERMSESAGRRLLPVFFIAGILSVLGWSVTETLGVGDLRAYAFVQFFPMLAIPLILILFRAGHKGTVKLVWAFVFYALAKLLEHFDKDIYALTHEAMSGHALKHVAAAAGAWCAILYMCAAAKQDSAKGDKPKGDKQ